MSSELSLLSPGESQTPTDPRINSGPRKLIHFRFDYNTFENKFENPIAKDFGCLIDVIMFVAFKYIVNAAISFINWLPTACDEFKTRNVTQRHGSADDLYVGDEFPDLADPTQFPHPTYYH